MMVTMARRFSILSLFLHLGCYWFLSIHTSTTLLSTYAFVTLPPPVMKSPHQCPLGETSTILLLEHQQPQQPRKRTLHRPRGSGENRRRHRSANPLWSTLDENAGGGVARTNAVVKGSITVKKKSNNNKKSNKRKGYKKWNKHNNSKEQNHSIILNYQIIQQENAQDVLSLVASQKGALSKIAAGGKLSSVNLSTAIHRLTKHVLSSNYRSHDDKNRNIDGSNSSNNSRSKILADPRFALLICSAAEALVESTEIGQQQFGGREMSTIAWAISKLNIAPPQSAMTVDDHSNVPIKVRQKSGDVRSIIFNVAKQRAQEGQQVSDNTMTNQASWIPKLSELCGMLVDLIVLKAMSLDRRSFRQLELSNLLYASATTDRGTEDTFDLVIDSMIESETNPDNTDMSKPQEWSIPLWCCAKSGITGPGERLMRFISSMLDTRQGFVEQFKPQELSNLAWATATILSKRDGNQPDNPTRQAALKICRHATKELVRRQGIGYKSQELTNSVWSLATLGFGITEEQSSRSSEHLARQYIYLPSDDPENDRNLMEESVKTVLDQVKKNHRVYRNQELNNLCWAMARLGWKDDEMFEIVGYELLSPKRRDLKGQDLSTSLWSMATLGYSNDTLYRDLTRRACEIGAANFNAQEISNTLWALGTARVSPKFNTVFDNVLVPKQFLPSMHEAQSDPVTSFFGDGAREVIRRPEDFKPQELKDVLLAFVWTETRHPLLFKATAEHLVGPDTSPEMTGRGVDEFNTQSLANLAYVFARHTQLGVDVLEKYKEKCCIPASGGRLAAYTTSYLDIGEGLLRKLFSAIAESSIHTHGRMQAFSPQDVANTVWSFAVMGLKHTRFLDAVNEALHDRMVNWVGGGRLVKNKFTAQELSNAIYAFASLNYLPAGLLRMSEAYFMDRLGGEVTPEGVSKFLNRKELAILCFTVAVFGEYPSQLVEIIYTGLIGTEDKKDPLFMERLYNDGGLHENSVTSLLYLQSIMDLEAGDSAKTFFLPVDFPTKWTSSNRGQSIPDGLMDNGLLELHSSKVQKRISDAFTRIGFSHTEEFVFTMEDISRHHGIRMAPIPFELLSVDIADEKSRICIEVDGPGHFITNIDTQGFVGGRNILSSVGSYRDVKGFKEFEFNWDYQDQEINGSTSLKIRLLRELGWHVVNLAFWEWYPVQGSQDKEEAYCGSLLDKAK